MQQVFWNILTNAVKFTGTDGLITVRVRKADGCAEVQIGDSGVGIRRDVLPFVFDRFRQGDSSTTRTHGGLGLGLAIVRHIVELHGGSVQRGERRVRDTAPRLRFSCRSTVGSRLQRATFPLGD